MYFDTVKSRAAQHGMNLQKREELQYPPAASRCKYFIDREGKGRRVFKTLEQVDAFLTVETDPMRLEKEAYLIDARTLLEALGYSLHKDNQSVDQPNEVYAISVIEYREAVMGGISKKYFNTLTLYDCETLVESTPCKHVNDGGCGSDWCTGGSSGTYRYTRKDGVWFTRQQLTQIINDLETGEYSDGER